MPLLTAPAYAVTDTRLANGLRVVVQEDHAVPVVALNIWYNVGSRHEQPGKTGFAHLFEHLMFQGSAHIAKAEHMQLVQNSGGTMNATTWCDRTNYFETAPSNHLELLLWLEADRMGSLALSEETLENQRDVVRNERRQRVDNETYGTWSELMHELAYPAGHPYQHSTIGSMADLAAGTLDDARAFYRAYYAPDNAVLAVVGDVDADEAVKLVEHYFGGIPAAATRPPVPTSDLPPTIGTEVFREVPDRVPVPRVFVGWRCPPFGTQDFDTAVVLSAVLGLGRGSRMYRELVLERELAQPPGGSFTQEWPFVGGGALVIADALAREGVAGDVLTAAVHECTDRLAEGVGDEEVARAQAMVASGWLARLGSLDGRADALAGYTTLFDDPTLVNTQLERYLAVTAADVVALAGRLLRPDNRVVLLYTPADEPT